MSDFPLDFGNQGAECRDEIEPRGSRGAGIHHDLHLIAGAHRHHAFARLDGAFTLPPHAQPT